MIKDFINSLALNLTEIEPPVEEFDISDDLPF